jgi:copper chaperone CopZ
MKTIRETGEERTMSDRTVQVPNISCGHCVRTIEREVGELDGVTSVSAEAATREVRIEWDDSRTDWEEIRKRMEDIHYAPAE